MAPLLRKLGVVVAALATLSSCGTARNVQDSAERYACESSADCVADWLCQCGYCQPPQGPALTANGSCVEAQADAGTSPSDSQGSSNRTDAGSQSGAICNLTTWKGCAASQGCYYNDLDKKPFCQPNGSKKEFASCKPGDFECGRTPAGFALLCDSVDSQCYRLCNTLTGKPCLPKHQCYTLETPGSPPQTYPQNTGICVLLGGN
ncbi:MAG TPA: hypothetical protein DCQ06_09160 [Myxococcales bacterium]|nr:hypothetical protein [Myxococcales bacterium]HAN31750.1 hypothetical protein [Myxococcales bacterium]